MEPAIEFVEFTVALPPVSLRANARSHWRTKKADADRYSEYVHMDYYASNLWSSSAAARTKPWSKAHVVYTWRYAGTAPDHGNLGGNTKVLQDCLQMAPANGAGANRYYLGLVENDSGLTCEYRMEKVAHRSEEGVVVTITKREET